jgi:hypothetical protein
MKLREIKLLEGGNALAQAGVTRIDKKFVPSTIELISRLSGVPKRDLHPLGTTGKNATSGDIDLGIDMGKYPPDAVHARLMTRLGNENHSYNRGTKVYSYAVPIVKRVGEELVEVGGKVQVDLMFTPHVDWAKFSMHSESTSDAQTSYKGAVRTILLKAVAAMHTEDGIDKMMFDPVTGELIIRVGRTFDLTHGLRRIFQYRPERKKGNTGSTPYVKAMKTVHTIEELHDALQKLKQRHPAHFKDIELDVADHEIIINDPAKVLKMIFPGSSVTPEQVRTAEQVLDLISQRFDPEMQERILTKAKDAIDGVAGQMRTPDIDAYLEHARKKADEGK